MKEIIGKNKKGGCIPPLIKNGDRNLFDTTKITSEFNNFYGNVGPSLAKKIPETNISFEKVIDKPNAFFVNYQLLHEEFEKAFKSFKRNKSSGHDGLNSNIVIESYDAVKHLLFKIFKTLISESTFPDSMKVAKVSPVFISRDITNVSNYGPISVLPVFSKILERIIYNRLYDYFQTNQLFYKHQFGFQKNNSTEHAILQLMREVKQSFEIGKYTLGVFIDLSKAFVTVDHKILFRRLEQYEIKGPFYSLIKNYLENRKQYIDTGKFSPSEPLFLDIKALKVL